MVFGSSLVLKLVDRFPIITFLGAGVLAFTAAKMIVNEPWQLKAFFATSPLWYWGFVALVVALVLLAGWRRQRKVHEMEVQEVNEALARQEAGKP